MIACAPHRVRLATLLSWIWLGLLGAVQHARADVTGLDAGTPSSEDASEHAPDAVPQADAGSEASAPWAPVLAEAGLPDASAPSAPLLADAGLPDVPPRALFVPELVLQGASVPNTIEALLRVNHDGSAALLECEASAEACAALAGVLPNARFEPARVDGTLVDARVRVRFGVRAPAVAPAPVAAPTLDAGAPAAPASTAPDAAIARPVENDEYGALARVSAPTPTAVALELEEVRAVPGTFGDPFRVIDALPGVVPVLSGIPYVYVRGAPPASTTYYYDDIQLPALFHLGLGPAVVHAAMIGSVDFYPGVAPARYGRKTGGVMAGQAANRHLRTGVHGELELRLIDVQAYVAKPFDNGAWFEVAGRYGYPGVALSLIEPSTVVQYWDYQLRGGIPIGKRTELSLTALGSYDLIGERHDGRFQRDIELQFHRLELRSVTRFAHSTFGAALGAGFERSGLDVDFDLKAVKLGPRLWLTTNLGKAKLRVGADMLLSFGELGDPRNNTVKQASDPPRDPTTGEELPGVSPAAPGELPPNPLYLTAKRRYVTGAYAELLWPFAERFVLEAGLRADVWVTGGDPQPALEPRLVLRYQAHPRVGLHVAAGLGYQPAVFMIPVPGLADVALDRGLQRVIQSEVGVNLTLPAAFSLETKLFLHVYDHMLALETLNERATDCEFDGSASAPMCTRRNEDAFGRMSAYSYGAELLLRRAFTEQVSGWFAYTLSWADGRTDAGLDLRPNFDVRHVANLIFLWRINAKWRASLRGYVQSGRFPLGATTELDPRARERLPAFGRGDLQIARTWPKRWGALTLSFDWLNFTFQREPIGWECPHLDEPGRCKVEYLNFPITVPMLGVRGSF